MNNNKSQVVTFADVQQTLTAITDKAKKSIDDSPHGAFWEDVDRDSFVNEWVDTKNPLESKFYAYLKTGYMPKGGPKATDEQLKVIETWLNSGYKK